MLGFVLLALGAALVYAGITGQSLVTELAAILKGGGSAGAPAKAKP